jgi:diguanylate cyclase (GGDEF)-like protein
MPKRATQKDWTVSPACEDVLSDGPMTNDRSAADADRTSRDDRTSATADLAATARDDAADAREIVSNARDSAATARDLVAEDREFAQVPGSPAYEEVIRHAAEVRVQAAADRAHAAMDREHAAMDRRHAQAELERANTDDLTGAYRRRAGEVALKREMARARRSDETLVLVFVDVDGLKATNDQFGHAAGDARLRDAVSAIQAKTRCYEPIVRYGGDEFLCSVAGADLATVRARFDRIDSVLTTRDHPGSLSFGLAQLRDDETLTELIERADEALIRTRGSV